MPRPLVNLALLVGVALVVSGCAGGEGSAPQPVAPSAHGDSQTAAREVAAPALHLTTVTDDGSILHLDLDSGDAHEIAQIAPATTVTSDGRYVFAARQGSVTIVDSGAWTWSHGDHFHYYDGAARVVGDVVGNGTPTVTPGERSIGIRFDGGEAVLVKVAPLADGEIDELFRMPVDAGDGLVIPLAYGGWVTESGSGGDTGGLREVDEDGRVGELTECDEPGGTIATVVGVVVACADGAVLAADGRPARTERIPAADGPDGSASTFTGREGRPTISALIGDRVIALLETRERAWSQLDLDEPLTAVVAVDDAGAHVVAATAAGDVLVIDGESGETIGRADGILRSPRPVLLAEQKRTYLVDGDRALVLDHTSATVIDRIDLGAAGTTVLTGR